MGQVCKKPVPIFNYKSKLQYRKKEAREKGKS